VAKGNIGKIQKEGDKVSFLGLLVNSVAVSRPTVAYSKGVATKTYTGVATNLACSIQYLSGGGYFFGLGSQVPTEGGYEVIEGWFGAFEYGANIQKDDKLVDEKSRIFIVKSVPVDVVGREHHIEAQLAIQEEDNA